MIDRNEALVNITWQGQNGDLPDPVAYDASADRVLAWVAEAIRTGGVPGVARDGRVDLRDFVVERYAATQNRPYNRIVVRPKTPFGAS
jgi:hypothetical protein